MLRNDAMRVPAATIIISGGAAMPVVDMETNFISKSFVAALVMVAALLVAGCAQSQSISDIKNPANVGKTVTVSGIVQKTLKIGSVSGYTLKDSAGDTIAVYSEALPAEGSSMTATGVLTRGTYFDYYVKTTG